MSNHLISQQFQFLDGQIAHFDNFTMDSFPANLPNRMAGHVPHNPVSLNFAALNGQVGVAEPMAKNSSFQNLTVNKTGQTELESGKIGIGSFGAMFPYLSQQKAFLPSKRKADSEGTVNYVPQHSMMPNKLAIRQSGTAPQFSPMLQPSLPNNKPRQLLSKTDSSAIQNLLVSNQKMVRNDSISSRSGNQRVQTPKGRTVQNGPLSKAQNNSSGAVRSKMREQLAAALALVSENQDRTTSPEKDQDSTGSNPQTVTELQKPGFLLSTNCASNFQDQNSSEHVTSRESGSADKPNDAQGYSAKFPTNEYLGGPVVFPDENVSFSDNLFVKDDLLQGNGLSWAFDLDMQLTDGKENFEVLDEESKNLSVQERNSPQKTWLLTLKLSCLSCLEV